jgi:predicted PurR-regulated permease PerM
LETISAVQSYYKQWPYNIRLCVNLLVVVLLAIIIREFKVILVPLYFSVLIAMLLLPFVNLLERIRFPKALSALVAVVIALLITAMVIYLLSAQIKLFLNDIPSIKKHIEAHYQTLQLFIEDRFDITSRQQSSLMNSATADMQDSGIGYVRDTVFTITETAVFIIFVFIYSFLILYYRHTIRNFLFAIFSSPHKKNIAAVITGSKQVIKNYMSGLIIEMIIISTSNALLFMIIGIKYAVFLGILTGILNIMPFIGIYSGMIFTALVTLTTNASMSQILWIFIGLIVIHFIDSNFLMPRIVGSKVKINALMTILGAITGGILIGIPGVFLALPTIAILKIIFDRIEVMQPWGNLLGDDSVSAGKKIIEKISGKKGYK